MNTALLGEVDPRGSARAPNIDPSDPPPSDSAAPEKPRAEAGGQVAAPPVDVLQPGECILGKYTVQGVLGYGGFAVVYGAEHLGLRRPVAIKVLHLRSETPLALVERFRREARISALVRHRNVLEAYDTGTLADGSPYLVMERINGQNLSSYLARAPLPIATVVEVGRQLLLGLAAIAEAGIVHRDVKPENVMLHDTSDGGTVVKLVDFGIARRVSVAPEPRLTYQGALVGTPQYMAPEQIRGEEVDVRADLYATGAILYEALTGHPPHETSNFSELVVAVLSNRIESLRQVRPNCPLELDRVVMKALSRARGRRYASAAEFLAALERVAEKYALPRGAHAFRVGIDADVARFGPARHSATFVRWLRSGPASRSRALQLTFMALLLGAPGAVLHVRSPSRGVAASDGALPGIGSPAVTPAQVLPAPRPEVSAIVPSAAAPVLALAESAGQRAEQGLAGHAEPRMSGGAPPSSARDRRPTNASDPAANAREGTSVRAEEASDRGLGLEATQGLGAGRGVAGARERSGTLEQLGRDDALHAHPLAARGAEPSGAASWREASHEQRGRIGGEAAALDGRSIQARASEVAAAELIADKPVAQPPQPWLDADDPVKRRAWQSAMQEGLAALVRGQLAAARERYLEAVRIDAREPSGFRGLGLVAARLGDRQQATTALARYLALAPGARDAAAIRARIAALSH